MAVIDWEKTARKDNVGKNLIDNNVTATGWLGFFDALGWIESSSRYHVSNRDGYTGIYQTGGGSVLRDTGFFDVGLGNYLLGVTNIQEYKDSPFAQELVTLMEFTGGGRLDSGLTFSSLYQYIRNSVRNNYKNTLSAYWDSHMMGQTVVIDYIDEEKDIKVTHEFVITKGSLSAPAHLLGSPRIVSALNDIFRKTYQHDEEGNLVKDSNGNLIRIDKNKDQGISASYRVELNLSGDYADGNNVAFSTYASLLQDFNIDVLVDSSLERKKP